jgi:hypothetical protein
MRAKRRRVCATRRPFIETRYASREPAGRRGGVQDSRPAFARAVRANVSFVGDVAQRATVASAAPAPVGAAASAAAGAPPAATATTVPAAARAVVRGPRIATRP